uniref:Uncharacterized protein n=1 Tax=Molossus molossus TaxID=27622 RepID=A0A7J8C8V2_MOLMO|nr:hypothetical protein HJG59_009903 [Molossus molossus]
MWSLRPKPLPAEFPSQALPIPILRCVRSAPGGQGLRHADPKGKETATQSPKAPCTLCSQPWAVCTHCPHGNLPWAPPLLHTLLWPKGFSLRISDFTPSPPNPGLQPHQALELGHIRGLLALPTHLYSQPGLCPPSTQTWPFTFSCSPELDVDLHKDCTWSVTRVLPALSDQVCCCPWGQDQKPTAFSETERQRLEG